MSQNDVIDGIVTEITAIFAATDDSLSDWKGDGNLQVPILLGQLAVKLNWNEKQTRENDPLVRLYIRRHPDFHITRGAKGGIQRRSVLEKKNELRAAKDAAKKQVASAVAARTQAVSSDDGDDVDSSLDD